MRDIDGFPNCRDDLPARQRSGNYSRGEQHELGFTEVTAPVKKPKTLAGSKMIAVLLAVFTCLAIGHSAEAAKAFHKPIISGFHPVPGICRVGDNYYLVSSFFEYFPGAYLGMHATGKGQTNSVPLGLNWLEYTGDDKR